MRKFFLALLVAACTLGFVNLQAQNFEHAGDYMGFIGDANNKLAGTYMAYLSATAHNKSARKIEKKRIEVVNGIYETRVKIQNMPYWKGDKSYRDSTVAYYRLLEKVFSEQYAKIVNMEEIAEQSYDAMEAYLLAKEKAMEKLEEANDVSQKAQDVFAAKNNVNIIAEETKLSKKHKVAGDLTKHHNELYLIFFKPYKEEIYLLENMNAEKPGKIVAIEQNINAMATAAEEGLVKLRTVEAFNNDATLVQACREALQFYKEEASSAKTFTDFFVQVEEFKKTEKAFKAKPNSKLTKADIDEFNKQAKEMNEASNKFNTLNNQLNKQRSAMLDAYNKAVSKYMDKYMPKHK